MQKVITSHIDPNREIKEGTLVRWPEYPDRLYFVNKTDIRLLGRNDYCEIVTIDNNCKSIVPITDLVWDDVDYIEIEETPDKKSITKLLRVFSKAFWEQLFIAFRYGDNHYPSVSLWDCWRSYVGADNKTYYDNWGILKTFLTKC